MRVDNITSNTFGTSVNIKTCDNRGKIYLYNEIEKIRKDFKIPATFKTEEIELPSVSETILAKLKELGINFIHKK